MLKTLITNPSGNNYRSYPYLSQFIADLIVFLPEKLKNINSRCTARLSPQYKGKFYFTKNHCFLQEYKTNKRPDLAKDKLILVESLESRCVTCELGFHQVLSVSNLDVIYNTLCHTKAGCDVVSIGISDDLILKIHGTTDNYNTFSYHFPVIEQTSLENVNLLEYYQYKQMRLH